MLKEQSGETLGCTADGMTSLQMIQTFSMRKLAEHANDEVSLNS